MGKAFFFMLFVAALQNCAGATPGDGVDPYAVDPPDTDTSKKDMGITKPDVKKETFCVPGQRLCDNETGYKICRPDGSAFETTACETPQICAGGLCKDPPLCVAGEKKCSDPATVSTCRASGEAWSAASCMAGEACIKGACLVGKINGSDCLNNEECASKTCHCGSDENCGFGQSGFCVSQGCEQGCEEGFCFNGQTEFAGRITGYNFCVERCEGACDSPEQECHDLPSEQGFDKGCYFGALNPIGGDCTEQADCAGEICRRDYFRESNLCTRNCDENTPCPDGTGCVNLDGTFQCTLLCGDGSAIGAEPCPLDIPDDRFDVTCKTMTTADGGALRVCVVP